MSHSSRIDGPYFTGNGSFKFGDLRSRFGFSSNSSIKASQLVRDTSNSSTNPNIPDCTENQNIPTSTFAGSNWKISNFRNSTRFYYVDQSGTDLNSEVLSGASVGQRWNGNLEKNILKYYTVNGTVASNSPNSAALTLNGTAYNMTVQVTGQVLGAGGPGASSGSGRSGGTAIYSNANQTTRIVLISSGRVYGGGGGGASGSAGTAGADGYCDNFDEAVNSRFSYTKCAESPNQSYECAIRGYSQSSANWDSCCKTRRGCAEANWGIKCWNNYTVSGGSAGNGGTGGTGIGYNNSNRSGTSGNSGGAASACGATSGNAGNSGALGGDWGAPGGNTTAGNGGSAGAAVAGRNYTVTANASYLRGNY